jgi:hypothetical protein
MEYWLFDISPPLDSQIIKDNAPALQAKIPSVFGNIGFQNSTLIFSSMGLWELTTSEEEAELILVTQAVKNIGSR